MSIPDDWKLKIDSLPSIGNDATRQFLSQLSNPRFIQSTDGEIAVLIEVTELSDYSQAQLEDLFPKQFVPLLIDENSTTESAIVALSVSYGAVAVPNRIARADMDLIIEVEEIEISLDGSLSQNWKVFRTKSAVSTAMQRDAPRKIVREDDESSSLRRGLRNTSDSSDLLNPEDDNLSSRESWFKKRH